MNKTYYKGNREGENDAQTTVIINTYCYCYLLLSAYIDAFYERFTHVKSTHACDICILSKFESAVALRRVIIIHMVSIKKNKKKNNIIEFYSAHRTERCTHPL